MILVTFISIHFVIICDVLLWLTYETHPDLSLKSGCDTQSRLYRPDLHYRGEWPGIHYVAFTKIPQRS
jgi:hypothetical protein